METELESSPELTEPRYTQSLISSPDSPLSPITPSEYALLDPLALDSPSQDQSKHQDQADLRGHTPS